MDTSILLDLRDSLTREKILRQRVEEKRAKINKASSEIGELTSRKGKEAATGMIEEMQRAKAELVSLEQELSALEALTQNELLRIPNLPDDEAPDGENDQSNVVRRTHDYNPESYAGRTFKPHWEVAGALGIYDGERAAKISGAMFALLRGDGAKLLRALVQFGLHLNASTYEEILAPHFVTSETFRATGHLPKFEAEAYRLRDDELWVIPTGEVPLMSIHRDEIIPVEELPKRYMAYTVCFRREAGSAGKDTRGMQRLHEFHKVELLKLCTPDQVKQEFEAMLADAERPLKLLGLPYRVVDLCAGDLTFSSARIYDLEVYAPGVDKWLEVSSVGIFTDFQARRGNIRFRRHMAKTEYVHALNGSALATPRIWAALIEHGQQPNGSVRLPEAIVPFMGKDCIVAKR